MPVGNFEAGKLPQGDKQSDQQGIPKPDCCRKTEAGPKKGHRLPFLATGVLLPFSL